MRKNFGAKPFTYPQPVFILAAFGEGDLPCLLSLLMMKTVLPML